jgi:hypothetical protein
MRPCPTLALVLALGLAGAPLVAAAQPAGLDQVGRRGGRGGPAPLDVDAELKRMTDALALTADQQQTIRPILADRQQRLQALFQDLSLSREDRRAKRQAIASDMRGKVMAVLTADQQQKAETLFTGGRRPGG